MVPALNLSLALVLVVGACSDGATASVGEYRDDLIRIADEFNAVDRGSEGDDELMVATIVFAAYEDAYDSLASLHPPDELTGAHAAFVDAFSRVQRLAAEYLGEGSMAGDFSFGSLNADTEFTTAFRAMIDACVALERDVESLSGDPVPAACNY